MPRAIHRTWLDEGDKPRLRIVSNLPRRTQSTLESRQRHAPLVEPDDMHIGQLRPYRAILKKPRNLTWSPSPLVGDVNDQQDSSLADRLAKHVPVDLDSSFPHLHHLNVHTSPNTVFLYSILAEWKRT